MDSYILGAQKPTVNDMAKLSRQTVQKSILQNQISKFSTFFTGEELFEKAKQQDKKLGIATVYRYLKDLRVNGLLHSYECNRKIIYSKEKKNHCHFICEKCGNIEHLNIEKMDFLKEKITGSICHFQIDISGICNKCKNK